MQVTTRMKRRKPSSQPGKKALRSTGEPPAKAGGETAERLQKLMAAAGLGSRRGLETIIKNGEVRLNDAVAKIGQSANAGDTISMGDRSWRVVEKSVRQRSLVYNKPLGEVTTRSDPQGRPTVFDRLPQIRGARWIAVGRLDINTSGLLLMTTDGDLAHAMMHPSNRVDREYACRIFGEIDPQMLQNLKDGVMLEDGMAQFSDIQPAGGEEGNHWFHVTILEGRNREVRRLWASQGLTVSRLKRVRYGAVFLPKRLRMGDWAELNERDHRVLREDVGLDSTSVHLTLQPEKGHRDADRRAHHRKKQSRKKSTRHKRATRS